MKNWMLTESTLSRFAGHHSLRDISSSHSTLRLSRIRHSTLRYHISTSNGIRNYDIGWDSLSLTTPHHAVGSFILRGLRTIFAQSRAFFAKVQRLNIYNIFRVSAHTSRKPPFLPPQSAALSFLPIFCPLLIIFLYTIVSSQDIPYLCSKPLIP